MSQREWLPQTLDDTEHATGSEQQQMPTTAVFQNHPGLLISDHESTRRMNRQERAPNLTTPVWRPSLNHSAALSAPFSLQNSHFQAAAPPSAPFLPPSSTVSNMYMNLPFHPSLMLSGLPPSGPSDSLFKPPLRLPPGMPANPYLSFAGRPPDSAGLFNHGVDPRLFLGRMSPPPFPRKLSPVVSAKPPSFMNPACMPRGSLLGGDLSCTSPTQPGQHMPWSVEETGGGTYRYHLPDRKALSFQKGTLIRMGHCCKRVEDLSPDDFVQSADRHPEYALEHSTVVHIEETRSKDSVRMEFAVGTRKDKVIMEVSVLQPFFEVHRGWCSYDPHRTFERLKLECHQLRQGDCCFTLANAPSPSTAAANAPRLFSESMASGPLPLATQPPPVAKAPIPPPSLPGPLAALPSQAPPPPPALPIPLPEISVDVETVGDGDSELAGGGKFFKKNQRWPWDNNSSPE